MRNRIPPPLLRSSLGITGSLGLVIGLVILAYSNSFHAPFTFDDHDNIVDNAAIRITDLSPASLAEAASESTLSRRWLPNITFALNYYFHGEEVAGYHLVNLAVHVLTAVVLFLLFRTTLSLPTLRGKYRSECLIALAGVLFWSLHPVQTNAVTYIVQRMTSLATLFFLLSLWLYIQGRLRTGLAARLACYGAALPAGLLALGSKENAVMLPVMILGYEIFFPVRGERPGRQKWLLSAAGLALLFAVIAGWYYLGGDPLEKLARSYQKRDFTPSERLLTEARVICHYLSLLFYPLPGRFNLNYDFPLSVSLFTPLRTLFAVSAVAGLVILVAVSYRRKMRLTGYALFWFLGNLAVESSFIPLEIIYEHRLYLPSTFLFLAVAAAVYRFLPRRPLPLLLPATGLALLLALFTWQRNTVWQSNISLWSDVLAKSPGLVRAYGNLGLAYESRGRLTEAEAHLLQGLARLRGKDIAELRPSNRIDLARLYDSLAMVHRKMGDYPRAMSEARMALHLAPALTTPLLTLGISHESLGRHQLAIDKFQAAAAKGLDTVDLYNNWAVSAFSLGRVDRAIELLEKALARDPDHPESHYNLGIAYSSKGMLEEARRQMTLASRLRARRR